MIFHPLSVLHPRLTSAPSQEEPELSATCGRGVKSKKCKTFCGRAVRVFDFNQPARMALVHIGNLETYVALVGPMRDRLLPLCFPFAVEFSALKMFYMLD
jgi:hypothetical protein